MKLERFMNIFLFFFLKYPSSYLLIININKYIQSIYQIFQQEYYINKYIIYIFIKYFTENIIYTIYPIFIFIKYFKENNLKIFIILCLREIRDLWKKLDIYKILMNILKKKKNRTETEIY